jgi:hypothetical protein
VFLGSSRLLVGRLGTNHYGLIGHDGCFVGRCQRMAALRRKAVNTILRFHDDTGARSPLMIWSVLTLALAVLVILLSALLWVRR